mmetsp:Transcript_30446/g.87842  ORF Transcript_30446/g.87842 Transcript_30446/m.87842 type:complete len:230 (+) Transcript_30446:1483-2172(+)
MVPSAVVGNPEFPRKVVVDFTVLLPDLTAERRTRHPLSPVFLLLYAPAPKAVPFDCGWLEFDPPLPPAWEFDSLCPRYAPSNAAILAVRVSFSVLRELIAVEASSPPPFPLASCLRRLRVPTYPSSMSVPYSSLENSLVGSRTSTPPTFILVSLVLSLFPLPCPLPRPLPLPPLPLPRPLPPLPPLRPPRSNAEMRLPPPCPCPPTLLLSWLIISAIRFAASVKSDFVS